MPRTLIKVGAALTATVAVIAGAPLLSSALGAQPAVAMPESWEDQRAVDAASAGQSHAAAVKAEEKFLRNILRCADLSDLTRGFFWPFRKRPRQPIDRIGGDQHGGGRHIGIKREARTLPCKKRTKPAPRGCGEGGDVPYELGKTISRVEDENIVLIAHIEELRHDAVSIGFFGEKQEQLAIRQPFEELKP